MNSRETSQGASMELMNCTPVHHHSDAPGVTCAKESMVRRADVRRHHCRAAVLVLLALHCTIDSRYADAAPENMLLVVNANDPVSGEIGALYQRLRHIPDQNVVRIPWKGGLFTIKLQEFREDLLSPILGEIRQRGLETQISYVTYSTGFPFAVDYSDEPMGRGNPYAKGSLTGLTYLHDLVLAKNASFDRGLTNGYYQHATNSAVPPTRGFPTPGEQKFTKQLSSTGLSKYLLATMLGYIGGLGNTKAEILAYLKAASLADASRPEGRIYLMRNSDIRSSARHDSFRAVVEELNRLGVSAVEDTGILPQGRSDVAGLVVGAKNFHWRESRSRILPGAICEHFTSFGGLMATGNDQTPLTEFLRYGAAGASGTVEEPTATPAKFPHPAMHVHYVRGCNLAESFYQSIASPYQLLVVGDPLCCPWGQFPEVTARIVPSVAAPARPEIQFQASRSQPVQYFELFVDGKTKGVVKPDVTSVQIANDLAPGRHEIRIVATSRHGQHGRGRAIVNMVVPDSIPVVPDPIPAGSASR